MGSTAGQAQVKLSFWRSVFLKPTTGYKPWYSWDLALTKAAVLENGLEYKCAVAGFISENLKRNEI
jgi:hypothetical protein